MLVFLCLPASVGGPSGEEVDMLRDCIPFPKGPRDTSSTLCLRYRRQEGPVGSYPVA